MPSDRDDPSATQALLHKLIELNIHSNSIAEVSSKANEFNDNFVDLQTSLNDSINAYEDIHSKINEAHSKYVENEVSIKNLENLDELIDSYISSIHVDESLSDLLSNGIINREYLTKQAFLYAKIELCNQMKHDRYPSLVEARSELNQLLDKSNKRIRDYLLNMLKESFKTGNFSVYTEYKYLYDHLYSHSDLATELLQYYSNSLKAKYLGRFDSIFKPFLDSARCSVCKFKSNSKLVHNLTNIFILDNREHLLDGMSINFLKENKNSYLDETKQTEYLFNQINKSLISISNQELELASVLFDVTDSNGVVVFTASSDFPELRSFLSPVLEAFHSRINDFVSNSDDVLGHFLVLTHIFNIMQHFNSSEYSQYNSIFSKIRLAFILKIQSIISTTINHIIAYNSYSIDKHKEYLKQSNNILDDGILLVSLLALASIRANESCNVEDISKLLNELVDTIINTIISLSILQPNKAEEEFYSINHLSILYEGLELIKSEYVIKRVQAMHEQYCHRHVNAQMRLMFKPLVEVNNLSISNLKSLSNNFIASYNNILSNVENGAKKIFWSNQTQDRIAEYAKAITEEIWKSFLTKIDTIRKDNPSEEIEELYNKSSEIII